MRLAIYFSGLAISNAIQPVTEHGIASTVSLAFVLFFFLILDVLDMRK